MIDLAFMVAGMVMCLWSLSAGAVWRGTSMPLMHHLYHELKPFYLPAVVVLHVLGAHRDGNPVAPGRLLGSAFCVLTWFLFRNEDDDDDRWKRRRRKLADRVQRQGARLVVVPEGAS